MRARGSGTPGRAATGRVSRALNATAQQPTWQHPTRRRHVDDVGTRRAPPVPVPTGAPGGTSKPIQKFEVLRAAWHAFPGVLAVWIFLHAYRDEAFRTWRAHRIVAVYLAPLTAACWLVEWVRLCWRRETLGSVGASGLRLLEASLRPSEMRRVHGTAWYLLGVCVSLAAYPADVAVLSICCLAWCDPAASFVGKALGEHPRFGGRFGSGKSFAGTAACALTGAATTAALFSAVFIGPTTAVNPFRTAPPPPPRASSMFKSLLSRLAVDSVDSAAEVEGPEAWRLAALALIGGATAAATELLGSSHAEADARAAAAAAARKGGKGKHKGRTKANAGDLLEMGRRSWADVANDNLMIPVVTGAVMYVARGFILGWID